MADWDALWVTVGLPEMLGEPLPLGVALADCVVVGAHTAFRPTSWTPAQGKSG